MAIAELTGQRGTAGGAAGTTSTVTYLSAPTEGNLLVAMANVRGDVTPSVIPSGWAQAVHGDGSSNDTYVFWKIAGASESLTHSWTWSGSFKSAMVWSEWSGVDTSSPVDKTNSGTATSGTASTGATGVLAQANELVIAAFGGDTNGTFSGYTSGYGEIGQVSTTGGPTSSRNTGAMAAQIVSATTTQTVTATWSASTKVWAAAVATFKEDSAVSATFTTLVGDAPAAGGTTSFTSSSTFTTLVGEATASGGVTTFSASGYDQADERESFDAGTNGNAIGNTDLIFDAGGVSGSATLTYSNTQSVNGTLSAYFAVPGGSTIYRQISMGSDNTLAHFCFYLYLPSNDIVGANVHIARALKSGGGLAARLSMNGNQRLGMHDGTSGNIGVGFDFDDLSLFDQWLRIEWKLDATANFQYARIFKGANLHGTTPDHTDTEDFSDTGVNTWELGVSATTDNAFNFYVDAVGWRLSDWAGPVGDPNPNGTFTTVAGEATASGGDSTFTGSTGGGHYAVTYSGINSLATGTTSAAGTDMPTHATGDLLVLAVVSKYAYPDSAPSGWTLIKQESGGNGASGEDSGTAYSSAYYRIATSASETSPTVDVTGGNVIAHKVLCYTKAGGDWIINAVSKPQNTVTASWSITYDTDPGVVENDNVLSFQGINGNDANYVAVGGTYGYTAPGITVSNDSQSYNNGTATGNDVRLQLVNSTVSAGSSTGAGTYTSDFTGTLTDGPAGASISIVIAAGTTATYFTTTVGTGTAEGGVTSFTSSSAFTTLVGTATAAGGDTTMVGSGDAISLVQDKDALSANSSTTVSLTLDSATTAGNLLVLACAWDKASDGTTINPPTGFTELYDLSSTSVSLAFAYKVADGTETTFTVTGTSAAAAGAELWVGEYDRGGAAGDTWDLVTSISNPTNESNTSSPTTGTTGSLASDGLAVAAMAVDTVSNPLEGTTFDWSNGYTQQSNPATDSGAGGIFVADKLVTASTTTSTTYTYSGGTSSPDQWSTALGVFAPASSATTFTTVAGDATAAGGSTTFTGNATFDTLAGDATAAGGSTTFTGNATFDTLAGNAPADGGSTTFTGTATFDTLVGAATADGGVTTFDTSSSANFITLAGNAPAEGGVTSFTSSSTFTTLVGESTADGGSTTFTGNATFDTVVGVATAEGGTGGQSFSDDFNRADASTLGANWIETVGAWRVLNNEARLYNANNNNAWWATPCDTDDNYAQIVWKPTTGSISQSAVCRGNGGAIGADTGYGVRATGTGYGLYRWNNDTTTPLGTGYLVTKVDGDVIRVEAEGSTITMFVNGVQRDQVTDTTFPTGKYVGIWSTIAVDVFDDFSAGDLSGGSFFSGSAVFDTLVGEATADGGVTTFVGSGSATFDTLVGTSTADGGSTTFAGTAVFDTLAGNAPADGGSTSFTGDAAFDTLVGTANADGGSTSFTSSSVFTTLVGDASADGGTTSFTSSSFFTTLVGIADASGGVTTFDASNGANFITDVGISTASGGSTQFTVDKEFASTEGLATADGGLTSFTVSNTFTTVEGSADASGGQTSLTGTALFDTLEGSAAASGELTSFFGTAEFTTLTGSATADGGSTDFLAGATFATTEGDASASGGVSSYTGTGVFTTVEGVATASGGISVFTGSGTGEFATTAGEAIASGGSTTFSTSETFSTIVGIATADGGSTSFTVDDVFDTTEGTADASGGVSSLTGSAVFSTVEGTADASGGSTSLTGTAEFISIVGEATASGGSTTFEGNSGFTSLVGEATAEGGVSSYTGTASFETLLGEALAEGGITTFNIANDGSFITTVGNAIAAGGITTFSVETDGTFVSLGGSCIASGGDTAFVTSVSIPVSTHNANAIVQTAQPFTIIAPAVVQAIAQVYDVAVGVSAEISAVTVIATATVPAVDIGIGTNVLPDTVEGTTSIPGVTPSTSSIINVTVVAGTSTVPTPTVGLRVDSVDTIVIGQIEISGLNTERPVVGYEVGRPSREVEII